MKKINNNIYPPGGYRFKETDGAWIEAQSWGGVVKKVREYRKRNNMPAGDPDKEVIEQVCTNHPGLCWEVDEETKKARTVVNLKGRLLLGYRDLAKTRVEFVPLETARDRGNVCARCPKNTELPTGCISCRLALNELRGSLIGNRPVDDRLVAHGCSVLGVELAALVHLDQPTIDNPALPKGICWRRREP